MEFKTKIKPPCDKMPFLCKECGKAFKHLSLLKSHCSIHVHKKYSCSICNKSYHYQASLFTHMQTHTNHRPYKCSKCAGAFLVKSRLHEHLKVHSNERPFLCEVCGKAFKFLSVLKSHLTIHTREEKYSCSECGKTYRYRASLYVHMHTHTGHRPHKCDKCAAAFLVKSHLTDHQRSHSGEKPFECEICSANFSRTVGLQKHLKAHIQNGLKMDLNSAMHKVKLRARAKPRDSPKDQPESRPSHHNEKEKSKTTAENSVICTGFHPDDEAYVVLTLSSIGDGSACSQSIEKQRADSKLSSKIMVSRSLPANENSQTYYKRVINSFGSTVYSRKTCAGNDDVKHPVCHDQPDSSQKFFNTKAAKICTPEHKPCTDIVDADTVPSKNSTSQTLVSGKAQTQASGTSGRSVNVSQHAELSNNIGERENKIEQIYFPMSKKKIEGLNVLKEPWELCEKSEEITEVFHGIGVSGTNEVDDAHSEHFWDYSLKNTSSVWEKRKNKHRHLQSKHNCDASHQIPTQHPRGVDASGNNKVDSSSPLLLPLTLSAPRHSIFEDPVHSLKCGGHNAVFSFKSKLKKQMELHSDPYHYICARCCKVFQQKASLARHHCNQEDSISPQRHTHLPGTQPDQSDLHVCDQCGKRFKKRFVLIVHYRKHTGEKPFVCQKCNKRFISATHRRVHRRLHTFVQPFQCPLCRKPYKQRVRLQHHLKVCGNKTETVGKGRDTIPHMVMICINPENEALVCEVNEQNLNSADLDHPTQPQHQAYSGTSKMKLDDQEHLSETEGAFEAVLEVKESYLSKKNANNKSTKNTGETCEKETYNPPECKLQKSDSGLWEDKAAKPLQLKPQGLIRCNYCPKSFKYQSAVISHERSHTGEKPFLCPNCGKGFSKKSNMETHMRMHTGERPFLCECCGRHFSHRYTLNAHRRLHTQEKPFECGVCGNRFRQETSRNIHLKRHAGEKKFKCDFCPKAFVTKVDLQDHRRAHTRVRPYRCDQCGRRFVVHHHLTDHRRLHRGDRPHKCQICSMTFIRARSWKQHMQTHTNLMREVFQ